MASSKILSSSQYQTLDMGVAFGITDTGLLRTSNQDNFLVSPELGLVAVADGMGGHTGGEIASARALELVCGFIDDADSWRGPAGKAATLAPSPNIADPDATWTDATMKAMMTLHDAIEAANTALYRANSAQGRPDGTGMGTTLTGIWQPWTGGPFFVFHVGDSRLYLYRDGALAQLTRDQTLFQQALDAGATAMLPPRNLLLQAVGPGAAIGPELQPHTAAPGDVYLLCSDGLYGDSQADDIAAILAGARADNLDACCADLVAMARRDGGRDNITAVLVRCPG